MMIKLKSFDKRSGGAGSANSKFSSEGKKKNVRAGYKDCFLHYTLRRWGGVQKGLKQSLPKPFRI